MYIMDHTSIRFLDKIDSELFKSLTRLIHIGNSYSNMPCQEHMKHYRQHVFRCTFV